MTMFCCLKGCMDGFGFPPHVKHIAKDNPIRLDTAFMGKRQTESGSAQEV